MSEQKVGIVSHYFGHIHVAGIEVTEGELHVGDTVHIKGHTSDFTQRIDSMQVEHETIDVARPGDSIGVRVAQHAREHDVVYRVTAD